MEFTGRPERPTGVRRMLYRLPVWLYRARLGVLLGTRFVLINHVGRKTGRWRQVVVEVVDRDPATGAVTGFRVDGSEADYLEAGRRIPMLRLEPLGNVGA